MAVCARSSCQAAEAPISRLESTIRQTVSQPLPAMAHRDLPNRPIAHPGRGAQVRSTEYPLQSRWASLRSLVWLHLKRPVRFLPARRVRTTLGKKGSALCCRKQLGPGHTSARRSAMAPGPVLPQALSSVNWSHPSSVCDCALPQCLPCIYPFFLWVLPHEDPCRSKLPFRAPTCIIMASRDQGSGRQKLSFSALGSTDDLGMRIPKLSQPSRQTTKLGNTMHIMQGGSRYVRRVGTEAQRFRSTPALWLLPGF